MVTFSPRGTEPLLALKCFFFLRLALTCEETCEFVWPPNASLYASSTCRYFRLLATSFDQGLKFKAQPTNALFATVNQMLGGSSQLPTTAERAEIKSNRRAQFRQHSRKLGGAGKYLIDGSEKRICRLSFEFRVRLLLKGAVTRAKGKQFTFLMSFL